MQYRSRPRRRAAPPVSRASAAIFARLAKTTRFADPALSEHWPAIAGEDISRQCRPGRITGRAGDRTLEICVPSGAAAAFVQMRADEIVALANRYLGPGQISRIRIRQTAQAAPEDPALGAALASFRAAIKRRETGGPTEN